MVDSLLLTMPRSGDNQKLGQSLNPPSHPLEAAVHTINNDLKLTGTGNNFRRKRVSLAEICQDMAAMQT